MNPALKPGEFVFITSPIDASPSLSPIDAFHAPVFASVIEDEGTSLLVRRADADAHGAAYDFVGKWITLKVNSDLAAVGLTAAVSTALAEASISCNVIAGHHHDHLIVPSDRAEEALEILQRLTA